MKVDHDRFIAELVGAVVDSVATIDDDLSANVEVILEYLPHLALRAFRTLVATVTVSLYSVEHEVVSPGTVHLVKPVLLSYKIIYKNAYFHIIVYPVDQNYCINMHVYTSSNHPPTCMSSYTTMSSPRSNLILAI